MMLSTLAGKFPSNIIIKKKSRRDSECDTNQQHQMIQSPLLSNLSHQFMAMAVISLK